MTPLHALLVLRDRSEAEGLAALIAAAVYAAPAYTDTVQGALDLLASAPYGVVILDDHPRGGTGLAALTRVRERYPALPVIMVSAARSEGTAIDAFHLGVTDYIPKKRGYGEVVAALVAQLAAHVPLTPRTRLLDLPDGISGALIRPTYQNRLRLIGDQCTRPVCAPSPCWKRRGASSSAPSRRGPTGPRCSSSPMSTSPTWSATPL